MGTGNAKNFLALKECQVVAACDVDQKHLEKHGEPGQHALRRTRIASRIMIIREMMARTDIDAVMLAVPDHWHALVAVEAARHKKDIYGEKPLARTIAEQQAIVKAVQENGRIWQTGSWQRSEREFSQGGGNRPQRHDRRQSRASKWACPAEIKNSGKPAKDPWTPSDPPPELDYEMWIGPSKMMPYIQGRVHRNWRWNYNTGGGQLMDWIGHHCDIAHWGCDFDNSGPSEIEGHGEFPPQDAVWNTCTKYRIELQISRGTSR